MRLTSARTAGRRALLLAAGEGSRLKPLTDQCPKPMIRIGSAPILEHNIRLLRKHGITDLAINLHCHPEVIRKHFGDGGDFGVSIRYSYEPELRGTAGALAPLRDFFHDRFVVLYGDNLSDCDLTRLIEFHVSKQALCTVALFHREEVSQSGVADIGPEGFLRGFVEKPRPEVAPSHWVSAGILVCEPEILNWIPSDRPSDFGRDVLPAVIQAGRRVAPYLMIEQLFWIDSPADHNATLELLRTRNPRVAFLLDEQKPEESETLDRV
jgi:mannose-1-phosphate guanylyltransferase